jgi:hypothetical protein
MDNFERKNQLFFMVRLNMDKKLRLGISDKKVFPSP